jgi:hypothetical protein
VSASLCLCWYWWAGCGQSAAHSSVLASCRRVCTGVGGGVVLVVSLLCLFNAQLLSVVVATVSAMLIFSSFLFPLSDNAPFLRVEPFRFPFRFPASNATRRLFSAGFPFSIFHFPLPGSASCEHFSFARSSVEINMNISLQLLKVQQWQRDNVEQSTNTIHRQH